jgi:FKBP-type peptidyl-prolyl cis-trans isomerase 2
VFPQGYRPEVGAVLAMETADGQTIHVEIKSVEGDTVVLDANHPLAGKTLLFDVEVLEVSKGR